MNIIAWLLKLSRHNIYYLVSGPLKKDIEAVQPFVYAYKHIETVNQLAKNFNRIIGNTIVDVGGGTATTAAIFSQAFPEHQLFIFEPLPVNFQQITESKSKTSKWKIINKAAGSYKGQTEMHIADRITASSLLALNPTVLEGQYADVLQEKAVTQIEITTLDSEIPENAIVDIVKLDVQGYELEVLKGAERVLKNTKTLVLEINNHEGFVNAPTYYEIDDFLRKRNFELYNIFPNLEENGKLMDWDAIYVNKTFK